MAIKQNIIIDQGTDFIYNIYLIDGNSNVVNISTYTANSEVRKSFTSNTYTAFTTSIDGNNGIITLTMNAATTATLTYPRYLYDVELTSNNNIISRIVEGYVNVNPSVTH